jgi:hypothetical protein
LLLLLLLQLLHEPALALEERRLRMRVDLNAPAFRGVVHGSKADLLGAARSGMRTALSVFSLEPPTPKLAAQVRTHLRAAGA